MEIIERVRETFQIFPGRNPAPRFVAKRLSKDHRKVRPAQLNGPVRIPDPEDERRAEIKALVRQLLA